MTPLQRPGLLARVLLRVGSWFVPGYERERFRGEWVAELTSHRSWLEGRGVRFAWAREALQAVGALTDGMTRGWEGRVETTLGDVRFAVRTLLRRPGFAALAVTTLALGIGASSAMFTLIDAVLLRPLPFPDPDELVLVEGSTTDEAGLPASRSHLTSEADFRDFEDRSRTLRTLAGWEGHDGIVRVAEGLPEWVAGSKVTERFFETLGITPRLGRTFTPAEHVELAPVVVLSDDLWRTHFSADPSVLGQTLELDAEALTVVGVMPAGFVFPEDARFWRPTHARSGDAVANASANAFGRDWRTLSVLGRLTDGVGVEAASGEFLRITAELEQEYPTTNTARSARVVPLHTAVVRSARGPLLVLMGAVSLLLVIACINVGSLLLVRVSGRANEVAVRTALGAGRARLIRQLLTESVVLALVGGMAGLLVGHVALSVLLDAAPVSLPRADTIGLDLRVILAMTSLSALSGIVFGAVPALRASRDGGSGAPAGGSRRVTGTARRHRLLGSLVVAQIGLSTVMVIGAGLFTRSFANVMDVDHGYTVEGRTTFQLAIGWERYPGWDRFAEFFERSRERVGSLPGVESVEHVSSPPLSAGFTGWYHVVGRAPIERGDRPTSMMRSATPGYFDLVGLDLVAGRGFGVGDDRTAPGVAVVNAAFAETVFGSVDAAIGQSLEKPQFWGNDYPDAHRIVGVVENARTAGLDREPPTMIFFPFEQAPMGNNMMLVETDRALAELGPALRAAMSEVDPLLPMRSLRTLGDLFEGSVADRRFAMQLSTAFGFVAFLLSVIGLHGLVAFSVAERRRELGLKRALGADDRALVREVLGRSLRWGAAGVGLGVVVAAGVTRLVHANLFGVQPIDALTYFVAASALLGATVVAGWGPARRALAVEPKQVIDA